MFNFWSKEEKKEPEVEAPAPTPSHVVPPKISINSVQLQEEENQPESGSWRAFVNSMPKLPNPGKYEELSREAKSITGTQEIFDGFRFDISKGVSEAFTITHSIGLGSVVEPASYNLGTSYMYKGAMLWGRIDTDGHLIGRYQQVLTDNLTIMLGGQAVNEPHSSGISLEANYKGDDYFSQFKCANGGIYGLSYMQSITPFLSLGCDMYYNHKQGLSVITTGGRYATDKSVSTVVAAPGLLVASYTHKVNEKVGLSTECTFQVGQYGFESIWTMGYEYRLRMSSFRGHIDSQQKVTGFLEEGLNQFSKFMLCGELDHKKKQYRFGLGIQMQL